MVIISLVILTVLAITTTLAISIVMTFFIILTAIRNGCRSCLRCIRATTNSSTCTTADGCTDNGTALSAHAMSHRSPCGPAQCAAEYRATIERKGAIAD